MTGIERSKTIRSGLLRYGRLEGLAEYHPRVTEEILTIAGSVRSVATLLAVLVDTKLHGGSEH
jgi:hypothetical protein